MTGVKPCYGMRMSNMMDDVDAPQGQRRPSPLPDDTSSVNLGDDETERHPRTEKYKR